MLQVSARNFFVTEVSFVLVIVWVVFIVVEQCELAFSEEAVVRKGRREMILRSMTH